MTTQQIESQDYFRFADHPGVIGQASTGNPVTGSSELLPFSRAGRAYIVGNFARGFSS